MVGGGLSVFWVYGGDEKDRGWGMAGMVKTGGGGAVSKRERGGSGFFSGLDW